MLSMYQIMGQKCLAKGLKEHDNRFQSIHIVDLFHSECRTENNQYDIIYRIILADDYRKLLVEAGFENIQIYGGYDWSDYNEKSK